jgi:hypothetical protein
MVLALTPDESRCRRCRSPHRLPQYTLRLLSLVNLGGPCADEEKGHMPTARVVLPCTPMMVASVRLAKIWFARRGQRPQRRKLSPGSPGSAGPRALRPTAGLDYDIACSEPMGPLLLACMTGCGCAALGCPSLPLFRCFWRRSCPTRTAKRSASSGKYSRPRNPSIAPSRLDPLPGLTVA